MEGTDATPEEVAAMVNEIDSEGTGEISFHDFVKVMSKKVTPDYTPDQVVSAFKKFANKKMMNFQEEEENRLKLQEENIQVIKFHLTLFKIKLKIRRIFVF